MKFLKFDLVSGKSVIVSEEKVKEIVTTKLSNRFFWNCGILSAKEVSDFLTENADFEVAKRCCWYILFHAENLVFSVYLLKLAEDAEDAERYLSYHKPLLKKLRDLYKRINPENVYEIADEMIELCLGYAIDPF